MIITATQIKITSILGFFRFIPRIKNINSQLQKIEGLLFIELNGLRTVTGWKNKETMKAFRNSGHHLEAMKSLKYIGKSKSITWESESKPSRNYVKEKLKEIPFK